MSENVYAFVGIIELSACFGESTAQADDSSLDHLLTSLAEHDSLADELALADRQLGSSGWQRVGDDSLYDGRASLTADLGSLVNDLEREYAQLCEALGS